MDNEINSYDYKPEFNFFKTGFEKINERDLYVGFELEAENSSGIIDCEDITTKLSEIVNDTAKQFIYYKHDGSLDYGIEIVSMPFTLEYFKTKQEQIKKMLQFLIDNGYKSHDVSTCGLHFHINKKYFGDTQEEIEDNIDKLIVFTEYYKDKIITLSRRSYFNYCKFLSDYKGVSNEEYKNILKVKKEKNNTDRYMVVNIGNENTIEFRVIKGTLKYETFVAMVEFIFSLAKVIKNKKLTEISWNDVIQYEGNMFLQNYCKERKIHPSSAKMKDISIQYIKEQYKIKKECMTLRKELIDKIYDLLKDTSKLLILNTNKNLKNLPKKFTNRINKEKMSLKYEKSEKIARLNNNLMYILMNTNDIPYFCYIISEKILRDVYYDNSYNIILNKKILKKIDEISRKTRKLQEKNRKVDD